MTRVAVIGAGVVGAAIAQALAEAGHAVALVDSRPGGIASRGSFAWLNAASAEDDRILPRPPARAGPLAAARGQAGRTAPSPFPGMLFWELPRGRARRDGAAGSRGLGHPAELVDREAIARLQPGLERAAGGRALAADRGPSRAARDRRLVRPRRGRGGRDRSVPDRVTGIAGGAGALAAAARASSASRPTRSSSRPARPRPSCSEPLGHSSACGPSRACSSAPSRRRRCSAPFWAARRCISGRPADGTVLAGARLWRPAALRRAGGRGTDHPRRHRGAGDGARAICSLRAVMVTEPPDAARRPPGRRPPRRGVDASPSRIPA